MSDRFDELISTTLKNYVSNTLEDQIFNQMVLFRWLNEKGGCKELQDGGEKIQVPLLYGKNSTASSYKGYDVLDTTPQTGIANAFYDWKHESVSITIDRRSERINSGKHAIVKLLKAKIIQAEMSLYDLFAEQLYLDGTGNENKDLLGFAAIASSTPATGIVGGINAADHSWWRNYQVSGANSSTAFDNLHKRMRTAYNTQSKGSAGDHPDLYIASQTVYEGFEGLLTVDINYNVAMVDTKLAEMGFENYKFKGARVVWDSYITSDIMYVLNSKYLKLYVDTQTDFINTPFIRPGNQDARTSQILWMGELCCSNRSKNGVITDIT